MVDTAVEHDLTMPHDARYLMGDVRACPPNCPYRRARELSEKEKPNLRLLFDWDSRLRYLVMHADQRLFERTVEVDSKLSSVRGVTFTRFSRHLRFAIYRIPGVEGAWVGSVYSFYVEVGRLFDWVDIANEILRTLNQQPTIHAVQIVPEEPK
jgi:hypothetical protein